MDLSKTNKHDTTMLTSSSKHLIINSRRDRNHGGSKVAYKRINMDDVMLNEYISNIQAINKNSRKLMSSSVIDKIDKHLQY